MFRSVTLAALALAPAHIHAQSPDAWDKQLWQWKSNQLMFYPWLSSGFKVVCTEQDMGLVADLSRDFRLSMRINEVSSWPISTEAKKGLWSRQGWGHEVRWALLDPDLKIVAHGNGALSGDALLEFMRGTGWRPLKERRADFLREHPEAGNVLADQVLDDAIAGIMRDPRVDWSANPPGERLKTQAPMFEQVESEAYQELATSLQAFLSVDGWQRFEELEMLCSELDSPAIHSVKLLEEPLKHFRQGLESELTRHPDRSHLWSAWLAVLNEDGLKSSEAWVSAMEAAPGQLWPPAGYAKAASLPFALREDAIGLERLAATALDRVIAFAPGARTIDERHAAIQEWTLARLGALARLERFTEAKAMLKSSRSALGKKWKDLVQAIGDSERLPIPQAEQKEIGAILGLDPVEDATVQAPRPLRLGLLGEPEWKAGWAHLKEAPAFDEFNPVEELAWAPIPTADQTRIRSHGRVEEESGWVLLDGEDVIAHGSTLPEASSLAAVISSFRMPRLTALSTFIQQHPDRLDARDMRLDELRRRMPHPRLEGRLVDDARHLSIGFRLSREWKPSTPHWETEAKRVLPQIEARLRRWPDSMADWTLWLDWSEVYPGKPSPATLLPSLPIWNEHPLPGRAQIPLRADVFKLVVERLKAREDWPALSEWCKAFWESGVRERVTFITRLLSTLPEARTKRAESALLRTIRLYVTPYQAALAASNRGLELQRLNTELEVLRPGLSRMK